MSDSTKAPIWFWIVAVILLLWNGAGVFNYIAQVSMTEEAIAALDESNRLMIEGRPVWATAAFAVAVWGGILASLALLLRKSLAVILFIVSLLGVAVQMSYGIFGSGVELSMNEIMFALTILLAGILSVWFARVARSRGWIS